MLLVQGQKYNLPIQRTGPGIKSWFWALGLVYFEVSHLCTYVKTKENLYATTEVVA